MPSINSFYIAFSVVACIRFLQTPGYADDVELQKIVYRIGDKFEIEFVKIAGGEFLYPPRFEGDSFPSIHVGRFGYATTEVTRGQFRVFVESTGYVTDAERNPAISKGWELKDGQTNLLENVTWKQCGFEQTDDHPVVCVSYNDALAFCQWVTASSECKCRLPQSKEFYYAAKINGEINRLVSGSQWEKHSNLADKAFWGELGSVDARRSTRDDGFAYTSPVTAMNPGEIGMYQLIGNVSEICEMSQEKPFALSRFNYTFAFGNWMGTPETALMQGWGKVGSGTFNTTGFRVAID